MGGNHSHDHGGNHHHHDHHHHGHHHRAFDNPEEVLKMFDNEDRDEYMKPQKLIETLNIGPKTSTADLGSCTGWWLLKVAAVAKEAQHYGADLEPPVGKLMEDRAAKAGLDNLHFVHCSQTDAKLPVKVDVVTTFLTYHHFGNRTEYFKTLAEKYVNDGGRLVIIETKMGKQPVKGPPEDHKIAPEVVVKEVEASGAWKLESEPDVMPYHSVQVYVKA